MKFLFLFLLAFNAVVCLGQNTNADFYQILRFNENNSFPKFVEFKGNNITQGNILFALKAVKSMENIDFRLLNTEIDAQGNKHHRYVQVNGGLDVFGSMWIAHETQGVISYCNGEVFEVPKVISAKFSGHDALNKLLNEHPNVNYDFLLPDGYDKQFASSPNPVMMILPASLNTVSKLPRVVYAVDLYASVPLSRFVYFVDAETLQTLFVEDKIESTNVPGKANTKYSGLQDIISDSVQAGVFRLREDARGVGKGIETYNMQKGTVYASAADFTDADNYWSNINSNFDEVAGDVHWGAEKTYDFYKNVLNRNSIDNNGFRLLSYVHYSTNYINAFWNGYFMTYGDGGSGYLPLTSLDVCGHEITHGLTQKTAALIYSNESGALNESFSDILGVSIDFYTRPTQANFRIGEQFGPGGAGLRDMSNPKIYQNPATYKGQYWIADKSDNGGVHYNSGVQNKWFYLLCKGDTGTNDNGAKYKVDSIGFIKAVQIAYKNLTNFLTPLSNYNDARFYSIIAARALYGDCSNEVKQVINAWYAVGVGDSASSLLKVSFNADKTISCVAPFKVQFFNTSENANAYYWDFGDGQTATIQNPTHEYGTLGTFNVKLIVYGCNAAGIDSVLKIQFVKIDPSLGDCKRVNMPKVGIGEMLTSCTGTLRDDGDTSNYGSLVYSIRSIVPANSSILKLTFKAFDFENQFDFLYVYDGFDTLSRLIGKFTGNSLPGGGILYCKSGMATFRQTSDYLVTGKGFEVDWQCIAKTNFDVMLDATKRSFIGRKQTSSELKSNQFVPLRISNKGVQNCISTTLKYSLNNGPIQSRSVALTAGTTLVNIGPFDLFPTGSYDLTMWVEDITDGVKENDTIKFNFQQFENLPIAMPYIENFETLSDDWWFSSVDGFNGNLRMDYENTSPQCRLRTNAGAGFVLAGTRSVTLDKSDRNWLFDTISQTNYITLTYNMSQVALLPSPLLFRFTYMQHGDKQYPNDAVWERGCDTCVWVRFYDLFLNKAATGVSKITPLYNLNYFLDSAKQQLTTSFQLRIGQQDQNSAINTIQYTGYSFDNLRFSVWNTGIKNNDARSLISIQPNPSKGIFMVKADPTVSRYLAITDVHGKQLWNEALPCVEYFEMNLSDLPPGVYFASFYDKEQRIQIEKVVIY